MSGRNSSITEQLSRFPRVARITAAFIILLAIAGLGGSSSSNFITFLFFEAIAVMVLGYVIQRLFFGEGYMATTRITSDTEYLRKRVGGLRPSYESEQTGLEENELERAKRVPEILTDITLAGLLALITCLILVQFHDRIFGA